MGKNPIPVTVANRDEFLHATEWIHKAEALGNLLSRADGAIDELGFTQTDLHEHYYARSFERTIRKVRLMIEAYKRFIEFRAKKEASRAEVNQAGMDLIVMNDDEYPLVTQVVLLDSGQATDEDLARIFKSYGYKLEIEATYKVTEIVEVQASSDEPDIAETAYSPGASDPEWARSQAMALRESDLQTLKGSVPKDDPDQSMLKARLNRFQQALADVLDMMVDPVNTSEDPQARQFRLVQTKEALELLISELETKLHVPVTDSDDDEGRNERTPAAVGPDPETVPTEGEGSDPTASAQPTEADMAQLESYLASQREAVQLADEIAYHSFMAWLDGEIDELTEGRNPANKELLDTYMRARDNLREHPELLFKTQPEGDGQTSTASDAPDSRPMTVEEIFNWSPEDTVRVEDLKEFDNLQEGPIVRAKLARLVKLTIELGAPAEEGVIEGLDRIIAEGEGQQSIASEKPTPVQKTWDTYFTKPYWGIREAREALQALIIKSGSTEQYMDVLGMIALDVLSDQRMTEIFRAFGFDIKRRNVFTVSLVQMDSSQPVIPEGFENDGRFTEDAS